MRLMGLIAIVASGMMALAAPAPSRWDPPAAQLATQIAELLGPGQARLTVRNLSTVPTDNIPSIRVLLEQDLKTHGVTVSGEESANVIRVTLSETPRERLWVAEVAEGSETRVTIVHLALDRPQETQSTAGVTLRKQVIFASSEQVLAALETPEGLITLEPEQIVFYIHATDGWREQKRANIGQKRPLARDPRGILLTTQDGRGFEAWLPGIQCAGADLPAQPAEDWQVHCGDSDDPWPIVQASGTGNTAPLKAFYNAARNYFTGVVTPGLGLDLPSFYSAALIPRPVGGAAMLVSGIDGKVQLTENNALKPVTGTRDWGSDFAALQSACGAGTQIIASSSGEAAGDSLRAYELPALEAIPASPPLSMTGTVTQIWAAPDGKSVLAVLRSAADEFEVDRVTALCN